MVKHVYAGSNHTVSKSVIVPVTVGVAVLLVVILLLIALCLCKRNRKPHKHMMIGSVGKSSRLETTALAL